MRGCLGKWCAVVVAVLVAAGAALAAGQETFGNKPLGEGNYGDWPGIVPVINHPSRVYHTWVNGNEHFYYTGELRVVNETLARFGEAKSPVREVVLRPGPGETRTFDPNRTVAFRWKLHLVGGIARHLTTRDQGEKVWPKHPVLTIYVDRNLDLGGLRIPAGLQVNSLDQVKARTREGLKSTDLTVRGWSSGVLAELDAYDETSREAVTALLKDKESWVRLNAAGALALFGKKAQPSLPQLRDTLPSADEALRKRLDETIEAVEKAEERPAAEKEHRAAEERIRAFLKQRVEG